MTLRVPRWVRLLILPMLIGAVLLMHGLDAHRSGSDLGSGTVEVAVVDGHAHDAPAPESDDHHDGGCPGCVAGHLMAACVAIIAGVTALRLARRLLDRRRVAATVVVGTGRVGGLVEVFRPPDPAWVRLSVMRC